MRFLYTAKTLLALIIFLFPLLSFAQLTANPNPCAIPTGQTNCDSNPPRIQRTYSTSVDGIKIYLLNRATNQFVRTLFDSVSTPTRTVNVSVTGITLGTSANPSFVARAFTHAWTAAATCNLDGLKPYTCMRNEGASSSATTDGNCNLRAKPAGTTCTQYWREITNMGHISPGGFETIDFTASIPLGSQSSATGTTGGACNETSPSYRVNGPTGSWNSAKCGRWLLNKSYKLDWICLRSYSRYDLDWPDAGWQACFGRGSNPFNIEKSFFMGQDGRGQNHLYLTVNTDARGYLTSIRYRATDYSDGNGDITFDLHGIEFYYQ